MSSDSHTTLEVCVLDTGSGEMSGTGYYLIVTLALIKLTPAA